MALSLALFVIPFGLGAFFLRFCFREERRVPGWVTAGLLAAWLVEKAVIISISMFVSGASLSLESLAQICYSGSYMTPWFDPCYIIVTFVGCILLGQLFGRLPMGRNKVRAAM